MLNLAVPVPSPASSTNGIIDKRAVIASRPWSDNRDQQRYRDTTPFVDTPGKTIDVTWYYSFDG